MVFTACKSKILNPKSKDMFDAVLIVDKSAGFTSHDVVAKVRRILRQKQVGHTGTLDPFATGVMVVLVGKATRLARFLDKDVKEYEAVIRFGFETDTGDLTGNAKELRITNYELRTSDIENALVHFRGEICQMPPMYSAKKIEGKKLYELARKGIEIERQPIDVKIYEIEAIPPQSAGNYQKDENSKNEIIDLKTETFDFAIRVACSAGTYIRTLAEDIGKKIGAGAHLAALRRTRAGKFDLSKAVTLEKLEKIVAENKLAEVLIPMNEAISHLPEIKLSETEILKTKNGLKLTFEADEKLDNQAFRMTAENAQLVAVGFYNAAEKTVQPKVVLV